MLGRPAQQLPALTGLRGIAALYVALHHFQEIIFDRWGAGHMSIPLAQHGYLSVDIFFLLSGFIIGHVHLEDFRRFSKYQFARFALLRFFRIYPLHMFFVFCLVVAVWLVPAYHDYLNLNEPERFTAGNFLASLLLVHYWGIDFGHPWNGVSWSLSVEILGYIAFPFMAFVFVRMRSKTIPFALAAFCLLALGLILMETDNLDHNLKWRGGMLRMAFEFTSGILINCFFRLDRERHFAWLGVACLAAIVISMAVHSLKFLIFPEFGGLILALCYDRDMVGRFCRLRPVMWLGEISFSLYVVHAEAYRAIQWFVKPYIAESGLSVQHAVFIAEMLLTLGFAALINYTVERPTRQVGRHLVKRLSLLRNRATSFSTGKLGAGAES